MTPQIKTCFKCGKVKSICEFYKHPMMKDGHLNKCKECTKKDAKENRKKNIIYYKSYDRKRNMLPHRVKARAIYSKTDAYKQSHKKSIKKHSHSSRIKRNARAMIRYAFITGRIIKMPCEICGETKNIQAHHEDYSKPLDVIWLCPEHHAWIHM